MPLLLQKPSQEQKILKVLEDAQGSWIKGTYFLHVMKLSQFHARIHQLQKRGYRIEASEERDEYNFKSYRILSEDKQLQLYEI